MSDYTDQQRDQQVVASPEAAANTSVEDRLKDLHTQVPGIINSFDPEKQTCTVQPAVQRVFTEHGPVNLPLCVDCPVQFPGGGGFFLTFPVNPGDECIIFFSERCIDGWYLDGAIAPPADYRMHDLSDGMVMVGMNNQSKKLDNFNSTDAELRSRDGDTRITMKPDGTIENVNGTGSTILSAAGKFTINAPGGFEVNAPNQTNSGNITAASGTIKGNAVQTVSGIGLAPHHHTAQGPTAPTTAAQA